MRKWFQKVRDACAGFLQPQEEQEYIDVRPERIEEHAAGIEDRPEGGLLSRLHHVSKRDQQIATLQAGYTELLGLVRSIREHLDMQAQAQDKIVDTVDRFNQTLSLMDETSKMSSRTMADLAERARESETLLRTMLERSERRLVVVICLLSLVTASVLGFGIYFGLLPQLRETPGPQAAAVSYNAAGPGIATLAPKEDIDAELSQEEAADLVEEPEAAMIEEGGGEEYLDEEILDYEPETIEEDEIEMSLDIVDELEDSSEESAEDESGIFGRRGFLFFRRD